MAICPFCLTSLFLALRVHKLSESNNNICVIVYDMGYHSAAATTVIATKILIPMKQQQQQHVLQDNGNEKDLRQSVSVGQERL